MRAARRPARRGALQAAGIALWVARRLRATRVEQPVLVDCQEGVVLFVPKPTADLVRALRALVQDHAARTDPGAVPAGQLPLFPAVR